MAASGLHSSLSQPHTLPVRFTVITGLFMVVTEYYTLGFISEYLNIYFACTIKKKSGILVFVIY